MSYVFIARPRLTSQTVARRNAQQAMIALAQRRLEREDTERYLAGLEYARSQARLRS